MQDCATCVKEGVLPPGASYWGQTGNPYTLSVCLVFYVRSLAFSLTQTHTHTDSLSHTLSLTPTHTLSLFQFLSLYLAASLFRWGHAGRHSVLGVDKQTFNPNPFSLECAAPCAIQGYLAHKKQGPPSTLQ